MYFSQLDLQSDLGSQIKIIEFSHLHIVRVVDDEMMNLKPSAFRASLENCHTLILDM